MSPAATLALVVGAVALVSLLLAVVPGPWRPVGAAAVRYVVVLLPVEALAVALAAAPRTKPLTWLALLPATFFWFSALDLVWGVSARAARGLRVGSGRRETSDRGR